MDTLRLYCSSVGMLLRCQMQYTATFLMQTLSQLVMQGGEMLAVILVIDRFGTLGRWNGPELMVFFGAMTIAFYITECFGRGITSFPAQVRIGRVDTFLVRPRGLMTQVICDQLDPRRLICIAVGILSLEMGKHRLGMHWGLLKWLVFLESMGTSVLLLLGLFLIEAVCSIWSVRSIEAVNVLTYGGQNTCRYPVDVYPKGLRIIFTWIAPLALTLHVPTAWILGKPLNGFPEWSVFVSPLAGAVFYLIMYLIFRIAIRWYRSTGS